MPQTAHKSSLVSGNKAISKPKYAGRKPVEINLEQLTHLVEIGCKDNEIAAAFGCVEDTLRRRFGPLLRSKREEIKAALRAKQLELALKGDRTMLIWLGKNLVGQTDKQDITASEGLRVLVERIG